MKPLISISYVNEVCFLSLNTDDKKYKMVIKMAEDDLKDLLGKKFFAEIQTQYDSDSFSTDNEELYEDYIKDYLAWQTFYNYLKFANIDATPTGIREFGDENSTIAADVKMYALEKNVLERANKYKYDLVNFIKAAKATTSTKFPYWSDCSKEYLSFAITAVDKYSCEIIKVNKAVNTNE